MGFFYSALLSQNPGYAATSNGVAGFCCDQADKSLAFAGPD